MYRHSVLVIFILLSGITQAQVYKWVDESGRVHYGEKPEQGVKAKELDASISVTGFKKVDNVKPVLAKKIIMYPTSWCTYCRKARKYFKSKDISFVEYDIERNAAAKCEYDVLKGRGVPLILAGKQRMNGFSVATFERIYQP